MAVTTTEITDPSEISDTIETDLLTAEIAQSEERQPTSLLRQLVDLRAQIQKERIRFTLRLSAIDRGADQARGKHKRALERYYERFHNLEEQIDEDIKEMVMEHPIYPHISKVKGVGPMLAAKTIALIDIERATMVSKLWRFAGLSVVQVHPFENWNAPVAIRSALGEAAGGNGRELLDLDQAEVIRRLRRIKALQDVEEDAWEVVLEQVADFVRRAEQMPPESVCRSWLEDQMRGISVGERERPVKGERLHYSIRLKTTLYLIAQSMMRSRSPYRFFYDSAKTHYATSRPGWTKGHIHFAAMRKMQKIFLSHLWLRWRQVEGLPTRSLWVEEHLQHTTIYPPEQFGWPPFSVAEATAEEGR